MFGNRNKPPASGATETDVAPTPLAQPAPARNNQSMGGGFATAPSRKPLGQGNKTNTGSTMTSSDQGKLVVGRDIKLAGEINACETLSVEGMVNAELRDTRTLEVLADGTFNGSANVDRAEISGNFEGDLHVSGLLIVTSTGRVTGTINCGELEMHRGGVISGTIEMTNLKSGRLGSRTVRPSTATYDARDTSSNHSVYDEERNRDA